MTWRLVKALGKAIGAVGLLVGVGASTLAALDATGVRGTILFGVMAAVLAAFAVELVADALAPDVDGSPEWADRFGSGVVAVGFMVVGGTVASIAVMPAEDTTMTARALVAAVGIGLAAIGLMWVGDIGIDDDDEADESEVEASAEGAEVSI